MSNTIEIALSIWGMALPVYMFLYAFCGIFAGSWSFYVSNSPFLSFLSASSLGCAIFMLLHYTIGSA